MESTYECNKYKSRSPVDKKDDDGWASATKASESNNAQKAMDNFDVFMKENGLCDDLTTSVVYQTHEDLRLIRKWQHVRVIKSEFRTYLAGIAPPAYDSVFPNRNNGNESNEAQKDVTQVIVPIASCEAVSPFHLQQICRRCVHPDTNRPLRCVTLAIVDDDSTTAYYRIFDQFSEIVHPQWKRKKKHGDETLTGTAERIDNLNNQEIVRKNDDDDGDGDDDDDNDDDNDDDSAESDSD